ncbi:MAG: hypothetical protein ACFFAS_13590 [Promethearchaeota archaeon]
MSLIGQSREIFVHIPLGATLFNEGKPIEGTYLNVELAETIILASEDKPVTFYEAPATAHKNMKPLFDKLGYTHLAEKYSQVKLLILEGNKNIKKRNLSIDYGFDYPPLELPEFLFDKENLIISFSNPKAPFSEKVAGFKGLPFSLSGKALILGSTLFAKKNLMHLAFYDVGLGLKDYIIDGLNEIRKAGVTCIGINGGRFAGGLIDNIKVHPVEWNILVISSNIGIADAVTASLMGFNPQEMVYFASLAEKGLIPSNLSAISVNEMGNGRARLEQQFEVKNDFLPEGSPITTRQWIFGLLSQVSVKDRLRMVGKIIPSIIKYKFSRKRKA